MPFIGSGGGGFTLGPSTNVFSGADRAGADAARDSYFSGVGAANLAHYNSDTSLNIRLEYSDGGNSVALYQVRSSAGDSWLDNSSSTGVKGDPGVSLGYDSLSDPVLNGAVSTSRIDSKDGVIVTLTTTQTPQSMQPPTNTASGKFFDIFNSENSVSPLKVDSTVIQPGEFVRFLWDGSRWSDDTLSGVTQGSISTSLIQGCTPSINADPTKFDISSGAYCVVSLPEGATKPTVKIINYAGSTGNAVTGLATSDVTALALDIDGNIIQNVGDQFERTELRNYAVIGSLGHPNRASITTINRFSATPRGEVANNLYDLSSLFGSVNYKGSFKASPNGANLALDLSAGTLFRMGVNPDSLDDPNFKDRSGQPNLSWIYTYTTTDGSGYKLLFAQNAIVPNRYDDGSATQVSTLPAGIVSNNSFSVHHLYYEPSSNIAAVQFGRNVYSNVADAKVNMELDLGDKENPSLDGFLKIAYIIVKGNATNLSDIGQAVFIQAPTIRSGISSPLSAGTTSLQRAYDNSTPNPEILTNNVNGGLSLRAYAGGDSTAILSVQNSAGIDNFSVDGNGNVLGGTFDGRDLSSDGAVLDNLNNTIGLSALTSAEVDQLENIGATTISPTQWGYVGNLDQELTRASNVVFGDVAVSGDLTVQGTTTALNTQDLLVEDKNIIIGNVSTPSDTTADGGGFTLKGSTDKTITWQDSDDKWHFNQGLSVDVGGLDISGNVLLTDGFSQAGTGAITYTNDTGRLVLLPQSGSTTDGAYINIAGSSNNSIGSSAGSIDFAVQAGGETPNVTIQGSTGSMGIGTTAPSASAKLDVSGNIRTSEGSGGTLTLFEADAVRQQRLVAGADVDGGFLKTSWGSGGSDNFSIRDAFDVKTLSIVDGNVGVGVDTPADFSNWFNAELIDIRSDAAAHGGVGIGATQNASGQSLGSTIWYNNDNASNTFNSATSKNAAVISAWTVTSDSNAGDDSGADLAFYTKPEAGVIAERMRIKSDGGIFATGSISAGGLDVISNPDTIAASLSVAHGVSGETYSSFQFNNTSFLGGDSEIRNIVDGSASTGSELAFYTTQTGSTTLNERMRIDNSGNVGVGTTNPTENADGVAKVITVSGGASSGVVIQNGTQAFMIYLSGGSGLRIYDSINNADRLTVKSDGVLNIANTPTYADDTAAGVGGLVAGDIYKTSTGDLKIKL